MSNIVIIRFTANVVPPHYRLIVDNRKVKLSEFYNYAVFSFILHRFPLNLMTKTIIWYIIVFRIKNYN